MATGTTLVAFKQALKTALVARAGLAGVTVLYAFKEEELAHEQIWFGDARTITVDIPVMRSGTKKVDETYELEVFVQVLKQQGEDQETADVRAAELLVELQQALAEQPQISATTFWAELSGWEHHTGAFKNLSGHGSRFDCTVQVRARLAP